MFWFFVWMNTVAVLACSFNNSQLHVCTLRQMSGGTSVPAQKNLRSRVPQRYIPSFHVGSFHLLALLACIHRHLFTNRFLFLFWWPVRRNLHFQTTMPAGYFAMSTILLFAACYSVCRLDWGYVLSHQWIGLSTIQHYFITGVAVTVCEGYRSFEFSLILF